MRLATAPGAQLQMQSGVGVLKTVLCGRVRHDAVHRAHIQVHLLAAGVQPVGYYAGLRERTQIWLAPDSPGMFRAEQRGTIVHRDDCAIQ